MILLNQLQHKLKLFSSVAFFAFILINVFALFLLPKRRSGNINAKAAFKVKFVTNFFASFSYNFKRVNSVNIGYPCAFIAFSTVETAAFSF